MFRRAHGHRWVGRVVAAIEVASGPFWEPKHPRPLLPWNEVWNRIAAVEEDLLLVRAAIARSRKSTAIRMPVFALVLSAMTFRGDNLQTVGAAALVGAAGAVALHGVAWFAWSHGAPDIFGMLGSAPPARELAQNLRLLADALYPLRDVEPHSLRREIAARGYVHVDAAIGSSWTLAPKALRRPDHLGRSGRK